MVDTFDVVADGKTTRNASAKEADKAVELVQIEPDAADEKNLVEQVKENELEVIDGKQAAAHANLLGQREREQLVPEQERLGIKAEDKGIDVENLSKKALEQGDANDIAECAGSATDRQSQPFTEREKNRRVELMQQVHSQFRVVGTEFHFKDQPGNLAFKDKGERMVSALNDDRVAKAMAMMADAKGWKTIKISGHPDFRREVWMQASLRGIEARGYKPTQQDLALLEDKRERAMCNTVEHAQTARERKPAHKTDSSHQNRPETAAKTAVRAYEDNTPVTGEALKSDKTKVAQAAASVLIDSMVKDPAQREALKAAVGAHLVEREKTNMAPAVPVYDKAAPAKSQPQEHPDPVIQRNCERTR